MNEYSYIKNGTEHSTTLAKSKKEAKRQFDAVFGEDCQVELNRTEKEILIDEVISQIENDILENDLTAVSELLSPIPKRYLLAFLPEKE